MKKLVEILVEILKNLSGIVSAIVALLERQFSLFPINPAIRNQMFYLSLVAALLSGFGAYQYARKAHKHRMGWIGLAVFLSCASVVVALAYGFDVNFDPKNAALMARLGYMFCFAGLGASVGGFLSN